MKNLLAATALVLFASACTTYPVAKDVKYLGFDDSTEPGKSLGPIEADDCVWYVFGYPMGPQPTLERAMANARLNRRSEIMDAVAKSEAKSGSDRIRYLTNVSSGSDGFDARLVAKQCLTVKGMGYR